MKSDIFADIFNDFTPFYDVPLSSATQKTWPFGSKTISLKYHLLSLSSFRKAIDESAVLYATEEDEAVHLRVPETAAIFTSTMSLWRRSRARGEGEWIQTRRAQLSVVQCGTCASLRERPCIVYCCKSEVLYFLPYCTLVFSFRAVR